jgi:hypothetical protein
MVSLLAWGLSTATNSTPESIRVATKARFRERRSSFAMTRRALRLRQASRARTNCGRSALLPLSTSMNSLTSSQAPPLR